MTSGKDELGWSVNDIVWDDVADVVVAGSGAAGLAAAVAATLVGASVVVLERADTLGGTTAKSSGSFWVPNNPLMKEEGLADPRRRAALHGTDLLPVDVRRGVPDVRCPASRIPVARSLL